ncbi:hypothetical protein [Bradyrhizobium sp. UFLA01-814]|uniref:hypothetical protein n=1 Tax=Bradyrhizobium sp. UFLA01-814 TaxID=3023480 RepID=UPI00398AF07E
MVLLEDTAAPIGISIAALGIFLADRLQIPSIDGIASILIGSIQAILALVLARENKELLIGERADEAISTSILELAARHRDWRAQRRAHCASCPGQIVVTLSLEFSDDLRTPEIEQCVESLERRIRETHPEVDSVFVKPQTARTFQSSRKASSLSGSGPNLERRAKVRLGQKPGLRPAPSPSALPRKRLSVAGAIKTPRIHEPPPMNSQGSSGFEPKAITVQLPSRRGYVPRDQRVGEQARVPLEEIAQVVAAEQRVKIGAVKPLRPGVADFASTSNVLHSAMRELPFCKSLHAVL